MKKYFRSLASTILLLLVMTGVELIQVHESFAETAQPIFSNSETYISALSAKQPSANRYSGSASLLLCLLDSRPMPHECSSVNEAANEVRFRNAQRLRAFNSANRGRLIPLFFTTKDILQYKKTPDCFGEFPSFPPELDGLTNIRKTE